QPVWVDVSDWRIESMFGPVRVGSRFAGYARAAEPCDTLSGTPGGLQPGGGRLAGDGHRLSHEMDRSGGKNGAAESFAACFLGDAVVPASRRGRPRTAGDDIYPTAAPARPFGSLRTPTYRSFRRFAPDRFREPVEEPVRSA